MPAHSRPRGVKPQSVCETATDSQHFLWVHGVGEPAHIVAFDTDRRYLRRMIALRFADGLTEPAR
jgi:hypothetical protein